MEWGSLCPGLTLRQSQQLSNAHCWDNLDVTGLFLIVFLKGAAAGNLQRTVIPIYVHINIPWSCSPKQLQWRTAPHIAQTAKENKAMRDRLMFYICRDLAHFSSLEIFKQGLGSVVFKMDAISLHVASCWMMSLGHNLETLCSPSISAQRQPEDHWCQPGNGHLRLVLQDVAHENLFLLSKHPRNTEHPGFHFWIKNLTPIPLIGISRWSSRKTRRRLARERVGV